MLKFLTVAWKPLKPPHEEKFSYMKQGPFWVRPITWLPLDFLGLTTTTFQQMGFFDSWFFLQVGAMTHYISTNGLHWSVPSQQKMKRLDGLIPKLAKFSSNGKHQLLTRVARMLQVPHVFGGPNVDTHFCDTFHTSLIQLSTTSLWAQFMYYILFYSFKHNPSLCNL